MTYTSNDKVKRKLEESKHLFESLLLHLLVESWGKSFELTESQFPYICKKEIVYLPNRLLVNKQKR